MKLEIKKLEIGTAFILTLFSIFYFLFSSIVFAQETDAEKTAAARKRLQEEQGFFVENFEKFLETGAGQVTPEEKQTIERRAHKLRAQQSAQQSGGYKLIIPIPTPEGLKTTISSPAEFVRTVFQFGMGAAGLVAMAMIIFGAIQYTISAGNPSLQKDAKDRILNAIYGLALLFGSYIILRTIDPQLTKLKLPEIKPLAKKVLELEERLSLNEIIGKRRQEEEQQRKEYEEKLRSLLSEKQEAEQKLSEQGAKFGEINKLRNEWEVAELNAKAKELEYLELSQRAKIQKLQVIQAEKDYGDAPKNQEASFFQTLAMVNRAYSELLQQANAANQAVIQTRQAANTASARLQAAETAR